MTPSQIFLASCQHPGPKHRTAERGIHAAKRVHDRLQPDLEDVSEKLADGFFRLGAGGIVGNGRAAAGGRRRGRGLAKRRRRGRCVRAKGREGGRGLERGGGGVGRVREVEEQEFGRGRGQEGGDVRGRKVIDALEIPIPWLARGRKFGRPALQTARICSYFRREGWQRNGAWREGSGYLTHI